MSPKPGIDLNTVLTASTEIVDTDGAHSLTLATLAKKLKIRSPSLYNHVDGLRGLQEALAIHGLEELYKRLSQAAIGRSKDEEAIHASRGLRSILHGFASLEQKNGFGIPIDLDVSIGLLIDTFLAGIHQLKSPKIME